MKLRFCLIISILLSTCFSAMSDELISIYLSNSDLSPVRIEVSSISTMKFKPNRVIVSKFDNTFEKFYFSSLTKITFNEDGASIETVETNPTASIYPNPAENNLVIEGAKNMYGSDVCIYSMTGVLITKHSHWNGETIDVSHLNPGIYFVNINSTTLKFVKQ